MKKLIVVSLIFEALAVVGVALLIYTAQPAEDRSHGMPHPGAPYSLQEDLLRTSQRLDTALDKVRWGTITMIAVSMLAQVAFLVVGGDRRRTG